MILDSYSLPGAELRWFCYSLSLYIGGKCSSGGLLGSSSCSAEISALMFCCMVLLGGGGGVLPGYLLPGLAGVGAWSLCLVEVARDSCWSQPAILGLVLLVMQLIYTTFISNNRALFHLWWKWNLVKHQRVSIYYENDCSRYKRVDFW